MNQRRLMLAFHVPAYRWMWASMFVSANGFMPFRIGQGWLLLLITDSPFMVGLGVGISGVATMICSPFGGVLADRLNRRTILILTQSAMATAVLVLGILTVTDNVELGHILIVSAIQGLVRGVEGPARSTLMYDLVGRGALLNAMAGRSLAMQSASIIGPIGAGLIMAAFGPGILFLVISGSFSLAALSIIPIQSVPRTTPPVGSVWGNLREGVAFAVHDHPIRTVMWTVLITESLGFSSTAMFPIVTRDVLHAGPIVLGLLSTFRGSGGIIGALVISGLGDIRPKGWVFMGAAFAFGALLIAFAFSQSLPLSLALILFVGVFGAAYDTLSIVLLQTLAPDSMRGRVMGLHSFLLSGISLGALGMGAIATWLGVKWAIAGGGGAVALNALSRIPVVGAINLRSTP